MTRAEVVEVAWARGFRWVQTLLGPLELRAWGAIAWGEKGWWLSGDLLETESEQHRLAKGGWR